MWELCALPTRRNPLGVLEDLSSVADFRGSRGRETVTVLCLWAQREWRVTQFMAGSVEGRHW